MDQIYEDIEIVKKRLKSLNCKTFLNTEKLLTVEEGADVTDTTNVTAAGALMDSEVTNLADVKAFDPTDYAPTPTADTNKTVLSLANVLGIYYNMSSAHSNTTYTVTGSIIGGFAQVLINIATEPTVTGATKVAGSAFIPSTDMYLVVNYNGNRVEYFFLEI